VKICEKFYLPGSLDNPMWLKVIKITTAGITKYLIDTSLCFRASVVKKRFVKKRKPREFPELSLKTK